MGSIASEQHLATHPAEREPRCAARAAAAPAAPAQRPITSSIRKRSICMHHTAPHKFLSLGQLFSARVQFQARHHLTMSAPFPLAQSCFGYASLRSGVRCVWLVQFALTCNFKFYCKQLQTAGNAFRYLTQHSVCLPDLTF